jgi:hypothetical protein
MTVARFAISLDSQLARKVRKAAGSEAISTWLADAAERKLRAEGLLRVVAEWESEQGELSDREMKAAATKQRRRRSK